MWIFLLINCEKCYHPALRVNLRLTTLQGLKCGLRKQEIVRKYYLCPTCHQRFPTER